VSICPLILKNIDPRACSGGFFHGILEGHTSSEPNFELNGNQIDKLCEDKYPFGAI